MFTLEYYTTPEKHPDHKSRICYYVLNDTYILPRTLTQAFANVYYEWFSDNAEVNEYYNPSTESHYQVGAVRQATHWVEGDEETHQFVRLVICFEGEGIALWCSDPEETPVLAWNYAHDIQNEVASHQAGVNYFPCFDINNLLREGVVQVESFEKKEIITHDRYYQIYANVIYKGRRFHLRMAQDAVWGEGDWGGEGQYGKVSVFQYKYLGEM